MKKKTLLTLISITFVMLFLVACSPSTEGSLVGTWKSIEAPIGYMGTITLELKSDKNFLLSQPFNESTTVDYKGTWSATPEQLSLKFEDGTEDGTTKDYDYTLSGKTLSIDFGHGVVKLTKV